jgi:hypothetical protein
MVAKITSPHSIKRALNYNEKKVQNGHAECIYAGNYLKDSGEMKFHEKLNRFQDLIALNERSRKSNALHISLNFHPTENFNNENLVDIASTYINKIGFSQQPFLVYKHEDAGHPHIHIVTTSIQPDGKRINTFNIGRNQSETARKEIEEMYGLIKASGRNQRITQSAEPANVQRMQYGKAETKRAITNVLDAVINHYKYTSLPELNAVLKLYNVVADRGKEDGRIFKTGGLLYKVLDERGNKIGVPVKASSIYSRPTLANLEKKFAENEIKRQPDKQKLKTAIDWILAKQPATLREFINQLQKEKVQTALRENDQAMIYGITFIDFRTKSVFNGSDLGKQYSIASLQQRITGRDNSFPQKIQQPVYGYSKEQSVRQPEKEKIVMKEPGYNNENVLQQMMQSEKNNSRVPFDLIKKRKKRRKII